MPLRSLTPSLYSVYRRYDTDFVADIGPIVSALQEIGIEAVGYHGEMDALSRQELYMKWPGSNNSSNKGIWDGWTDLIFAM